MLLSLNSLILVSFCFIHSPLHPSSDNPALFPYPPLAKTPPLPRQREIPCSFGTCPKAGDGKSLYSVLCVINAFFLNSFPFRRSFISFWSILLSDFLRFQFSFFPLICIRLSFFFPFPRCLLLLSLISIIIISLTYCSFQATAELTILIYLSLFAQDSACMRSPNFLESSSSQGSNSPIHFPDFVVHGGFSMFIWNSWKPFICTCSIFLHSDPCFCIQTRLQVPQMSST